MADADAVPALPVAGLTPLTTLDYPGRLACVVFLQGCPLRCGYCHNPHMIPPRRGQVREWLEVESFLETRRGLLEAVVFSGGEPTRHPHLLPAIQRARERGFGIGLHTAGSYPRRLSTLIPDLDWVGLDVKGDAAQIDRITGRGRQWRQLCDSLDQLLAADLALECRTTVHWLDFDEAAVERLARWLAAKGVRHYALQWARPQQCLSPSYQQPSPIANPLPELAERLRPLFETLSVR
ncbi:anaerobic ribonucleoside-triphosphate reductase activating protein [Alloalcanivorax xenomutans]|jgi:pyruvate formate lyase activating enzyme|uniref:Anaerobic ribonucleoside-triphosphate reductase activating protein n=1 Tax=Alloalcanivorax xenomutans TaxID=1094342 RepID=A0A9Q3ZGD6_9GAMM|nr:anaerobic ribonucleoside-triphosphate reductase activating protein [Alloalcanivorax xenomutans]KYZ87556.1 anaerobic ribonucleoside-triphosphate reductase activating protein [Alcanivorax sp. KX64203]MBA4721736.1 anaerobic ribonucleoside-triphosphate reductase activating protein [Alcanivorax sp.]ARB46416.1 anaerobic ribonucleoside-triphosphate reductase activating protein [Alloalcanivorax xenomutans]MCE7510841.1 anaerobic ribonucleoside-triphosphate reductase activating protein [Alloalcanivora|tara:strand:- start:192 stop:902 length:711 start_codon:yes stop_codon:yes gene_type:complete